MYHVVVCIDTPQFMETAYVKRCKFVIINVKACKFRHIIIEELY